MNGSTVQSATVRPSGPTPSGHERRKREKEKKKKVTVFLRKGLLLLLSPFQNEPVLPSWLGMKIGPIKKTNVFFSLFLFTERERKKPSGA